MSASNDHYHRNKDDINKARRYRYQFWRDHWLCRKCGGALDPHSDRLCTKHYLAVGCRFELWNGKKLARCGAVTVDGVLCAEHLDYVGTSKDLVQLELNIGGEG